MAVDDKYVMNGVWLTCDKGVTPSRFNVTPKPVQLYDEHFANELDKLPLVNIMPFGACAMKNGTPCLPVPVAWERVMDDGLTVLGARPLLDTSKCQCSLGGQIAIHFTKADASAAVALDQKLDQVDEVADQVEKAAGWAFWGGLACAVGGAILVATGVGAPLGAAMIVGGGELMEASTVLASAAAVVKGATKFARDPSKEAGLSIVGEVATNIAINFIMNKLGGAVVKKLGKWAQKAMNKLGISERASKLANRILCTVTGHPVDVISGYLYTETVDFEFPGPIPLRWERLWNSTSIHAGPLGHGWHHSYDLALVVVELEGYAALRGVDGRGLAFDVPALGERTFNRLEKMSLLRDARGYGVLDHDQHLTYRFGPANADGVRALASVENANGFAIRFTYDERGHLTQVVDSAHREFAVSCDAQGRILAIITAHPTEPRQRVTLVAYSYNRGGELVSAKDALGQAATYKYANGLLVRETFKNGLNFYFEYAGQGPEARCTRTWGDEGIYDHKLVYDLDARRTVVTNSLGYATTYQGNENGLVVEVQDARGGVTRTEYNEYNEALSDTDPLGHATHYAYDERGNCIATVLTNGAQLLRIYDAQNRLIESTDVLGSKWQWTYSDTGQLVQRVGPDGIVFYYTYIQGHITAIAKHSTRVNATLTYDSYGNLCEVVTADGQRSSWLYDGWSRTRKSIDPRGNVQWLEYDLLNRVVAVHEPDGNVRRFTYDAQDNIIQLTDNHRKIDCRYASMRRLTRRTEAGTELAFFYDTEGQLHAVKNEQGLLYSFELDGKGDIITETGFDGLTRRYVRNVAGYIDELILPSGRRTRYEYDEVGRVIKTIQDDGCTSQFNYRHDGSLLSASNSIINVSFELDSSGNTLKEIQGTHVITNEYNKAGQRVSISSSLGAKIEYLRNKSGQTERITAGVWQGLFGQDAQGLETYKILNGGVRNQWKHDQTGRPVEQTIIGVGGKPRTRNYYWESDDRLSKTEDSLVGVTNYSHDSIGNLISTRFNNDVIQFRLLDSIGNIFKSPEKNDRQYGTGGQLLWAEGFRYTYDIEGNLIKKVDQNGEEWIYSWNTDGLLASVLLPNGQIVSFSYDALGRRISKMFEGKSTQWLWDGNTILHEWTETSGVTDTHSITTWVFEQASFTPVAKIQQGNSYSIVSDHLGTPIEMFDSTGRKEWGIELDSYGKVRQQQGVKEACLFRYQGQYEDQETGLYYNRFRYYAPEEGMYISQDPLRFTSGLRYYSYVKDTTKYVDILGWEDIWFRSLRPEDITSINKGNGIIPKNPMATNTPLEHVLHGSTDVYGDQYVSLTKERGFAERWATKAGTEVAEIDLDKVSNSKLDLSTGAGRATHLGDVSRALPDSDLVKGNKFAKGAKELLVEGAIPQSAVAKKYKPGC